MAAFRRLSPAGRIRYIRPMRRAQNHVHTHLFRRTDVLRTAQAQLDAITKELGGKDPKGFADAQQAYVQGELAKHAQAPTCDPAFAVREACAPSCKGSRCLPRRALRTIGA